MSDLRKAKKNNNRALERPITTRFQLNGLQRSHNVCSTWRAGENYLYINRLMHFDKGAVKYNNYIKKK